FHRFHPAASTALADQVCALAFYHWPAQSRNRVLPSASTMHSFGRFVNLIQMRIRRLFGFVTVIQLVLLLIHFLLYETWTYGWSGAGLAGQRALLRVATAILAVSFVGASLLAFRYTNSLVRFFYRIAAVWLGAISFLSFAACLSWMIFAI